MSARHPAGQSDFTLTSSAYRPATPLSNHRSFPRTVPLVVGRIYRCWTCVYYSYLEPCAASVTVFAVYHTAGINSISAPGIPSYTSAPPYNQLSPTGSCLCKSATRYVVFWREPNGVIPRATGDWLTGRWDSRKVLRHCHNTWKTLNLRKTMLIIQVLTPRLKIRTFRRLLLKILTRGLSAYIARWLFASWQILLSWSCHQSINQSDSLAMGHHPWPVIINNDKSSMIIIIIHHSW